MKYLLVLCCIAAAVIADDKYTNKYDNIDLDEILQNKRLFDAYVNCIMERGKCTAEGKELKGKSLPTFFISPLLDISLFLEIICSTLVKRIGLCFSFRCSAIVLRIWSFSSSLESLDL